MTLLNELNVGSQQYGMMGVVPMGTCATPAGTAIKESAFADDFELSAGNLISVTFTYANTYGDGSTTYPSLKIGSYTYPIKYPTGAYAASGAWANGQAVTFMFDGVNLIMTHPIATAVQAGNNLPVSSAAVNSALGIKWQGTVDNITADINDVYTYCCDNFEPSKVCAFRINPNSSASPFGTSSVTIIYCLSSVNYGWIVGLSDRSDCNMAISYINNSQPSAWQKVALYTRNVVSNTVNLTTSNALTGYGDYLSIAVSPGAFVSGQLSAVYRYSEPLQTSIFAGANPTSMTSFLKLSDNDSGYCAFSFYNSSGSTQYLVPAVRYQDNGYAIEPGDISISLIVM